MILFLSAVIKLKVRDIPRPWYSFFLLEAPRPDLRVVAP